MIAASVLLTLAACATTGCKTWTPRSWGQWGQGDDEGNPENDEKLIQGLRPREQNATFWGTDPRSRQVERNVGIGR
ncbi:MAG: hypothetical protein DCC68_00975 [Planctomycetota bacterium]|nr:MAG: hypothetical protein DCC68_00975 [Planctomycetota bacterium]